MDKIINSFQGQMERPGLFSLFHIISLVIIIIATIIICYLFKNVNERKYKRIMLIGWIICIVLEVMKQIIKSFHYGNPSYWQYDFYDFPFHICSSIFYIAPIIIFTSRKKHPLLYDAAIGYFCFFLLLGGTTVTLYTDMVYSNLIFTNVQTMIHHGLIVVLGIYSVVWNHKELSFKMFLKSLIVLAILMSMAIIINVVLHPFANGIDMFFINPLEETTLPVVNVIQRDFGYPVYLAGYILVMSSLGFITYVIEKAIINCIAKRDHDNM